MMREVMKSACAMRPGACALLVFGLVMTEAVLMGSVVFHVAYGVYRSVVRSSTVL